MVSTSRQNPTYMNLKFNSAKCNFILRDMEYNINRTRYTKGKPMIGKRGDDGYTTPGNKPIDYSK